MDGRQSSYVSAMVCSIDQMEHRVFPNEAWEMKSIAGGLEEVLIGLRRGQLQGEQCLLLVAKMKDEEEQASSNACCLRVQAQLSLKALEGIG